jgi:hypothetical protein
MKIEPELLRWADVESMRAILSHEQLGICPICRKKLNNPCLDHQHTKKVKGSGQIRGVLCRSCNVLLGKIENNCARYSVSQKELPEVLHNMAKYLLKEHLPYLHPSEAPKPKKLKKSSYNKLKNIAHEASSLNKFPEYPKSGKITKPLEKMYEEFDVEPEFYAN